MENFKINSKLDIKTLKSEFKKNKSVVIENFLEIKDADKIYNFLVKKMPEEWWYTSYMNKMEQEEMQAIQRTPENIKDIGKLYKKVYRAFAMQMFSYIFDRTGNHVEECNCLKCQFDIFITTDQFKNFIEKITNIKTTENGEVFASRFTGGQFLGPHHDEYKGTLNFVYSLSKNWKPEYGGNLYLLEDDYKTIKKVILSSYNRLALTYMNSPDRKELGTPHFVSQLSNGCVKPRVSITGWIS
jgi:Rps23 Pro-64 3,4-dihydroxylase Tpa1-like proline 4-hydroxylase